MEANDNVRFQYTRHAEERRVKYTLTKEEVENIILHPEWTEVQRDSEDVTRAFGRPTSQPDKYFRVPHRYETEDLIIVITVHPDRDATPPEAPT